MKEYENRAKIISENNWNELSRTKRDEIAKMLEHMDDIRDVNQEVCGSSYYRSASCGWRC
jgi:hypothetical protein